MDELDFTEEEIKEQLETLGYHDVPQERLQQFKRDLEQLVGQDRTISSSNITSNTESSDAGACHTYRPMNGRDARYPLDEASNRPTYTYRVNGTSGEHATYGKENLESVGQPTYFQKEDYRHRMEPRVLPPSHHGHHQSGIHIPAPAMDPTHHLPETEYSMYSEQPGDISIASTTSSDRRVIKRKVLRKRDGLSEVFDESVTDSDAEISQLQERLRNLPVSVPSGRPKSSRSERPVSSRPLSSRETPCYRLPDHFEGPKALIRPMTGNPHTKNVRKNDPVSRYQQYQQSWQSQRAPGEKSHNSLRWNVREQMLYHDEVVEKKPQKSYVANSYVVPSDKMRKNLRWQIRNDMAQGVIPPSAFD